jgi:hypothetical protein
VSAGAREWRRRVEAAASRVRAGLPDRELSYLRTGMRPLDAFHAAYAEARMRGVPADVLARAGRGHPAGERMVDPVEVEVHADGSVHLENGRHRLAAARAAGAREILARVREYGPRGGLLRERVVLMRIAEGP